MKALIVNMKLRINQIKIYIIYIRDMVYTHQTTRHDIEFCSRCMNFLEDPLNILMIAYMNGRLLSWHSEVRHLGNFFNNRLCNSTDSNQKASHFIGQFNKLYSNFGYL